MKTELAGPIPAQKKAVSSRPKFSVVPYLFILPHLVFFILFLAWPLAYGIYISLFEFDFSFPGYRPFIGLGNYQNLFNSASVQFDDFWRSVRNTGLFILYSVPPLVIIALLIAVLLNGKYPGRNFFRGLFFAPWSLSAVVASLLGWWLFQDNGGLINTSLRSLGLPAVGWLGSLPWAWVAITLVTVWWTVGFNSIIFLAALQDIPETLYEAASIDGATVWQQFISVTLPLLRPVLLFVVTITLIASANLFAQPIIMTRGGPAQGTETVIMRIYREGFESFRMGSAAAMSIIVAIILLIFTVVNFRVFGSNEEKNS
jgi:multiple sugar transport system permease protein